MALLSKKRKRSQGEDGEGEGERGHGVEPGSKTKLITGEHLRDIKDATILFRSNSFKFQIDALLPHVRPKVSRRPPLDRFLLFLYTFLFDIPSVQPEHPLDAARRLSQKGVSIPYSLPLPAESTNWKVAFERPSDITLIGSWANELAVKGKDGSKFGVDLAIEMPQSLFQEKDYLNGRFFNKRAFYLATIVDAIVSSKDQLNVEVSYFSTSNDPRLTALVISPIQNGSSHDFSHLNASVYLFPVLPSASSIPLLRLSPSQSNIRISPSSDTTNPASTPLYNAAILKTLTPKSQLLTTHAMKEIAPAFSDALTLLRVWANQRGYGDGTRLCVRGFERRGPWWSAVLGLLIEGEEDTGKRVKTKRLGSGLSSYQLFKAVLDFLAKHQFEHEPIFLKTLDGHKFQPMEYQGHHDAIFVDPSSTINLLSGVSLASLDMLQHDAKKSLELLDSPSDSRDPFRELFLEDKRDLCTRFDTIIRVDLTGAKERAPSLHSTLDWGSPADAMLASLASFLRRGLGNRVKAISILHPTSAPWPVSQERSSNLALIHVGLVHDPEHAFRLVDHGPTAAEEYQLATEEFHEFWGQKAELRRFKDGRITESVVWDVKTSDERAHIPFLIVKHILNRHFGLAVEAVKTWQAQFDSVLRLPATISRQVHSTPTTTGFKGALAAFDDLVRNLKALGENIPLAILSVTASSEYLRYTSVFTPIPASPTTYMPMMEIILEFEKSAKWPDDLRAIQKVKLAFFERIAAVLMTSVAGLKATVVVGDGIYDSEIQDASRLEIVTPSGWAFSARTWNDREATLLDRILDKKAGILPHVTQAHETDKKEHQLALNARKIYTRRFIHGPRHHRAIASLCHRFPAYASTVRLLKRWLASHWLLRNHVSEEAVELLCASCFIGSGRGLALSQSGSENIPGSKERGFALVVEFLKGWKWEGGLFIPLYGGAESNGGSVDALATSKGVGSNVSVWSISTEVDEDGHVWTSHGPDLTAAHRIRALAKATWEHLLDMENGTLDVKTLFLHPTSDYDFLIRLNPGILPRYYQNVTANFDDRVQPVEMSGMPPRPGFDPAQLFFDDLQFIYADTVKLFYDPLGGDLIGAVWDPSLKSPRPFRVLGGFSGIPCKDADKRQDNRTVILNRNAVLDEIARMGKGLITKISVQTQID